MLEAGVQVEPAAVGSPGEAGEKLDGSVGRAVRAHTAGYLNKRAAADASGKARYLASIAKNGSQTAALKAARTSRAVLWRWREEDLAFTTAEAAAREELTDALEAEAVRRAYHGVQRPVYQQGALVGYVTDYSDAILMMMLKAARPEKYRDRVDLAVNQIVKTLAGLDPREVL